MAEERVWWRCTRGHPVDQAQYPRHATFWRRRECPFWHPRIGRRCRRRILPFPESRALVLLGGTGSTDVWMLALAMAERPDVGPAEAEQWWEI